MGQVMGAPEVPAPRDQVLRIVLKALARGLLSMDEAVFPCDVLVEPYCCRVVPTQIPIGVDRRLCGIRHRPDAALCAELPHLVGVIGAAHPTLAPQPHEKCVTLFWRHLQQGFAVARAGEIAVL